MPLEPVLIAYAGLACWAMSTARQRRNLGFAALPGEVPMRTMAVILLAAAGWAALALFGPYQGVVAWIGSLCVAGLALLLLLSHSPRLAVSIAVPFLAVAAICRLAA